MSGWFGLGGVQRRGSEEGKMNQRRAARARASKQMIAKNGWNYRFVEVLVLLDILGKSSRIGDVVVLATEGLRINSFYLEHCSQYCPHMATILQSFGSLQEQRRAEYPHSGGSWPSDMLKGGIKGSSD